MVVELCGNMRRAAELCGNLRKHADPKDGTTGLDAPLIADAVGFAGIEANEGIEEVGRMVRNYAQSGNDGFRG